MLKSDRRRNATWRSTTWKTTTTRTLSTVVTSLHWSWRSFKPRSKTTRKTIRRKKNKTNQLSQLINCKNNLSKSPPSNNGNFCIHRSNFIIPTQNATRLSWWKISSHWSRKRSIRSSISWLSLDKIKMKWSMIKIRESFKSVKN